MNVRALGWRDDPGAKDLGDLAQDDAKTRYVEVVEDLSGGPVPRSTIEGDAGGSDMDEDDGEGDGGFGGPVFSRPAMPFAESRKGLSGNGGDGDAEGAGSSCIRASDDGGVAAALGGGGGERLTVTGGVGSAWQASHTHLDPLSDACKRGDVEALKRATLMGLSAADLAVRDEQGRTPLHWAADGGYTPVALALLQLGAEVDAVDDQG